MALTKEERNLLVETGTDVKWLKSAVESNANANTQQHNTIIEHLTILNGQVSNNKQGIAINKWVLRGMGTTLLMVITVLLHLMGIF